MKIIEVVEKMDSFSSEERVKYLPPLLAKFSPVSVSSLREFQDGWDGSRPFEEFTKAQNEVIRMCVDCEASSVGADIRNMQGLPAWNMMEELEANNE